MQCMQGRAGQGPCRQMMRSFRRFVFVLLIERSRRKQTLGSNGKPGSGCLHAVNKATRPLGGQRKQLTAVSSSAAHDLAAVGYVYLQYMHVHTARYRPPGELQAAETGGS